MTTKSLEEDTAGAWSPDIKSTLPSQYLPMSTMFRPVNVTTSIETANELSGFTGLPIQQETSMGISPLGEAYVNFGVEGGIAFMAVFGILFSALYRFVATRVIRHPDLIFWIPLIFYQGIKAETEMIVVLNQLVKGSLIVAAGYFAVHHVLLPMMNKQGSRRPVRLPARMPVARRY